MEYSHSDTELIQQPIGYWSWAAYKAVVTRTRGALAELGTTQPQWWVLHQVASAPDGRSRAEVTEVLRGYLDVGDALAEEIGTTVARGWLTQDADGRLRMTPEGAAFYAKAAALQEELWAERHEGITDEEYLTTLKVLQRFIHNTGGRAWHH
ncbi:transcriptional regulator [Streptomyces sp. Ru73]|uniref:winged helix DNA-binding protein n=1 Tax=Streptomyces sp. Ru73 TaxID=2080748 RepID=UPI000CDE30A7|nr:winged helix DNA-binding protein [Streptomyces sp. Ru73]POX39507.1 transcriptional regulator [Streptomyces sp. Ru73]